MPFAISFMNRSKRVKGSKRPQEASAIACWNSSRGNLGEKPPWAVCNLSDDPAAAHTAARMGKDSRHPILGGRPLSWWRSSMLIRTSSRHSSRSCAACFVYRPCLTNARRILCRPSGVFGPVLRPPCSLQRPFRIAGQLQAPPLRVFAPHFLTTLRSPLGLSFLSRPRRRSWGLTSICIFLPPGCINAPYDRLTAVIDVDMLYSDLLLTRLSPQAGERL
jgi:hypothetical protein